MLRANPSQKVKEDGEFDKHNVGTASVSDSSEIIGPTPIKTKTISKKQNMMAEMMSMISELQSEIKELMAKQQHLKRPYLIATVDEWTRIGCNK